MLPDIGQFVSDLLPFLIPMLPYLSKGGEFVIDKMTDGAFTRMGEMIPEKAIEMFSKFKNKSHENILLEATIQQAADDPENSQKISQLKNQLEIALNDDQDFFENLYQLFSEAKSEGLIIEGSLKAEDISGEMSVIKMDKIPEGTKLIKSNSEIKNLKKDGKFVGIEIKSIE